MSFKICNHIIQKITEKIYKFYRNFKKDSNEKNVYEVTLLYPIYAQVGRMKEPDRVRKIAGESPLPIIVRDNCEYVAIPFDTGDIIFLPIVSQHNKK